MTDFSQLTDSDLIESVNAWRRTRNITNNGVNDIAHRKYTKLVREGEEEIRNRAALDEDTNKLSKVEEAYDQRVIPSLKNGAEFHKDYMEIHDKKSTSGSPEYVRAHSAAANAHKEAAERYKIAYAQLSRGKLNAKDAAYYTDPARELSIYANKLSTKANALKEETNLNEDTSRLDKDNIVHYNNDTSEFAKHYVRGHKGDHTDGGPTAKHKKDSNTFHSTYSSKDTRNGFAGAGTTVYTHNKTGDKFKVDKNPSGKGFYGTDHLITKIHESVNEAVSYSKISLAKKYLDRAQAKRNTNSQ